MTRQFWKIGQLAKRTGLSVRKQLDKIHVRREELGEERIRVVEAEWPKLIAAIRMEMDKGTDPADACVQALAHRWQSLVEAFTGGDPDIAKPLGEMYRHEWATIKRRHEDAIPDADMFAFVKKALATGDA